MKRTFTVIAFILVIISLFLFAGCKTEQTGQKPSQLFNESLNEQIENLTDTTKLPPEEFKEFYFNYTPRNDSKYEIARDDIFMMSNGNFTSAEISFFGVMLGDSYEEVIARLGNPNVEFTAEDKSYINMDYMKRIGLNATEAGLGFHLENNTVTRITVRLPFNKYLHGNTTLGQSKELIYALLDVPDYQSFFLNFKVFHYVEKGLEIYFRGKNVDRMSFIYPKDFKGVEYVSTQKQLSAGVVTNVTEPVEIE